MSDFRCVVKGLQVSYSGSAEPTLKDIDLTVSAGECVMVGGLSGCGKSTLLRAIADVLPGSAHKQGEITLPLGDSRHQPRLGWVQQNPETQLFCLTPLEEVKLAFEIAGESGLSDAELVDYLDRFDLRERAQSLNRTLSSGEKQLVVIASVLAGNPNLIILDEPTSFISPTAAQRLVQHLNAAKLRGAALLIVEHNRFIEPLVDRLVFLEEGAIAYEAKAKPFPESAILQRFGLEPQSTGRQSRADSYSVDKLRIEEVSFAFGVRKILTDVNINLEASCLHILHGLNGSGKSTLLQLIAGYLSPQHGRFLLNQELIKARRRRALSYCIFALPERQFLTSTVKDELQFGGVKQANPSRFEQVLHSLDLSPLWNRSIRELSMGQKQRLVLAVSLLQDREILLMDEPTLGMDWRHIHGLMNLIGDCLLKGKTVVMATHHQALADLYGDKKHELRKGVLVTS